MYMQQYGFIFLELVTIVHCHFLKPPNGGLANGAKKISSVSVCLSICF